MKKKEIDIRLVIFVFACFVAGLILFMSVFWVFFDVNNLKIDRPYLRYECGYDTVVLSPNILLSPSMKNPFEAVVDTSDESLSDTEINLFNVLNTKDKDYLETGRYIVNTHLKDQSETILLEVVDTQAPVLIMINQGITIKQSNYAPEKILNYIDIFDYDEKANFAVFTGQVQKDKSGAYPFEVLVYDSYGNYMEYELQIILLEGNSKDYVSVPFQNKGLGEVISSEDKWNQLKEDLDQLQQECLTDREDLAATLLSKNELEELQEKDTNKLKTISQENERLRNKYVSKAEREIKVDIEEYQKLYQEELKKAEEQKKDQEEQEAPETQSIPNVQGSGVSYTLPENVNNIDYDAIDIKPSDIIQSSSSSSTSSTSNKPAETSACEKTIDVINPVEVVPGRNTYFESQEEALSMADAYNDGEHTPVCNTVDYNGTTYWTCTLVCQ